jgi:hypothetical protein
MGKLCEIFAKGSSSEPFFVIGVNQSKFPEIRKLTKLPSMHVINCMNSSIAQEKNNRKVAKKDKCGPTKISRTD